MRAPGVCTPTRDVSVLGHHGRWTLVCADTPDPAAAARQAGGHVATDPPHYPGPTVACPAVEGRWHHIIDQRPPDG